MSSSAEGAPAESAAEAAPVAPETAAEATPRKVRFLRLKAAIALPILFGAAALTYWFMIDGIIRDQLLAGARTYAGANGESEVANVSFSIFGPKLRVENLSAWQTLENGQQHEVIFVKEAVFDIEFWQLLTRRLVVNEVSATSIRWQQPISPPEPAGEAPPQAEGPPTDTSEPALNDYLKKAREILESEELKDIQDLLEKLKEYTDKEGEAEPAEAEPPPATAFNPGPSGRAWYVAQALQSAEAQPMVVVKRAALAELDVSFAGDPAADKKPFVTKITQLELSAESVTSSPVAYGKPMQFKAAGNLDGDAERRVELGLTIRFDPTELLSIEQVDGKAGIRSLDVSSMVDPKVFGTTLRDVSLSLTRFSDEHGQYAGRTRLMMAGALQPPGFDRPARASFALWFGGFDGDGAVAMLAPSGISVQVEDFPLDPILGLAGGSPLPLAGGSPTISFGTCDEQGNFGSPMAAFTWHDGLAVKLRLKVNGLRFAEDNADTGALPAKYVLRGLNRVIEGMGGLDLVVGFQGRKDAIMLDLERPGLRGFVDAIVNALTLEAADIRSLVDLPFEISDGASIGLASVNADGTPRDPKLTIDGEARHDFNDLRVSFNLGGMTIRPKAGQKDIMGLPADEFCRAFNALLSSSDGGLKLRTRIMNEQGAFSPALESPGVRGIVDAMVGVLDYTGEQLNTAFDLPFVVGKDARAKLRSVDEAGNTRGFTSPGAESADLSGLRVVLDLSSLTIAPKAGQTQIMGLPAGDVCRGMNTFLAGESGKLVVTTRLFGADGAFSPAFESPGPRGLIDAVVGALSYRGDELGRSFNLPFNVAPAAVVRLESVDKNGTRRGFSSPGANSADLNDLRVRLASANFTVTPKPGTNTILGLPAREFCTGFNSYVAAQGDKGLSLDMRVFDGKGGFAPALQSPGTRGLLDAIAGTMKYSGEQLNKSFNLPFEFVKDASADAMSVEPTGTPRTMSSKGADSDSLGDFHLQVLLKNGFVAKKAGVNTILGLPADSFTFAWNRLMTGYKSGFPLRLKLFNDKNEYAPAVVAPNEKDLVTMLGKAVGIDDFAKNFNQLPAKFPKDFADFQKRGLGAAEDIRDGKITFPELPEIPGLPKKDEGGDKKDDKKDDDKPGLPKLPKLPFGK